ncbi:MAG: nucleotide pyrophosphohydrolase [Burkholderiaceae bacterium]
MTRSTEAGNQYFREITQQLRDFSAARNWDKHHAPRNLAASVSIEAAELLELFQWENGNESWDSNRTGEKHQRIREELADVLIYAIRLADLSGIDIPQAISDKIARNAVKYPPTHHDE